jgi:hypothetical protein
MTQQTQVLNHLKKEPLTPLVALRKYGTLRLAALVFNLRYEGYNIKTEMVNVGSKKNPKTVAQYSLLKNKTNGK